jgi:hypothetical protein
VNHNTASGMDTKDQKISEDAKKDVPQVKLNIKGPIRLRPKTLFKAAKVWEDHPEFLKPVPRREYPEYDLFKRALQEALCLTDDTLNWVCDLDLIHRLDNDEESLNVLQLFSRGDPDHDCPITTVMSFLAMDERTPSGDEFAPSDEKYSYLETLSDQWDLIREKFQDLDEYLEFARIVLMMKEFPPTWVPNKDKMAVLMKDGVPEPPSDDSDESD